MAKRQRSLSLSLVLLRFALGMFASMFLCFYLMLLCLNLLFDSGTVCRSYVSSQQVERLFAENTDVFSEPGEDFLSEYALFDADGSVRKSNASEKEQQKLAEFLRTDGGDSTIRRQAYADGTVLVVRCHSRSEFADPTLRRLLPPFDILWISMLGILWVLCLILSTLRLRKKLAARLRLFGEVSERIGAQDLDFQIPRAGIREFDQALGAMEEMQKALYRSLSAQWAAQQTREAEIASLAHDLKTPLTLAGGNAELLLEEELPDGCREMAETIAASARRARQYVACLLESSAGADEPFEAAGLRGVFDELCGNIAPLAQARGVRICSQNQLSGSARIQRSRMLRALGNAAVNAVEHTPPGGCIYLDGSMTDGSWRISIEDEGPGFSQAALCHAAERLWRDDNARGFDGHSGIGLWFASQVAQAHEGTLLLSNRGRGGARVAFSFPASEPPA